MHTRIFFSAHAQLGKRFALRLKIRKRSAHAKLRFLFPLKGCRALRSAISVPKTRFCCCEQSFQRAYRRPHGALMNALMNARARALMERRQHRPRTRPHERPHESMRAGAIQARDEGAMPALINLHGSSMRAPMRAGAMKARDEGAMRAPMSSPGKSTPIRRRASQPSGKSWVGSRRGRQLVPASSVAFRRRATH